MEEIKKLSIPDGYEFDKVEDGEVMLKKKEVVLPKRWEECYMEVEAKYLSHFRHEFAVPKELVDPIGAFCQLLICRNAWWKQLGWKPDWSSPYQNKYTIIGYKGGISITETELCNTILAFPTEEVRDLFYETFKDLIEEATELL